MTAEEVKHLVEKHGTSLYRFCCHLTGNIPEAEDLYQDTFLKAVELCRKFDSSGDERSIRNYLIGISVNLWKNQRRKAVRRQKLIPVGKYDDEVLNCSDQNEDIEAQVIKQELLSEIRTQIQRLPDQQRIIMILYYSAEMSTEEISVKLHISVGTVRGAMSKARKKIRKSLEATNYEL